MGKLTIRPIPQIKVAEFPQGVKLEVEGKWEKWYSLRKYRQPRGKKRLEDNLRERKRKVGMEDNGERGEDAVKEGCMGKRLKERCWVCRE